MKTSSDFYIHKFLNKYKNQFDTTHRPNDTLYIPYFQEEQRNHNLNIPVPFLKKTAVIKYIKDLANFITHDTNVNYIIFKQNDFNLTVMSNSNEFEALEEWKILTKALSFNKSIISFQSASCIKKDNPFLIPYSNAIQDNRNAVYQLIYFMQQDSYKLSDDCTPQERAKYYQKFKLYQLMRDYFIKARNINEQTFNKLAFEINADLKLEISKLTNEHFKKMDYYIKQHYWEITGVIKNIEFLKIKDPQTASMLDDLYFICEIEAVSLSNFASFNKNLFDINSNVISSETRDFNNRTKLIINSYLLNSLAVKELLNKRVNVNAVDDEGYNALHRTIEYVSNLALNNVKINQIEIVKLLISAKININVQTNELKLTPLHLAAKFNNAEVIKLLIDAGADLYIENYGGRTPLETAIKANRIDAQVILQEAYDRAELITSSYILDYAAVKELLAKGVYVNAVDNEGYNALHRAIENNHITKQGGSYLVRAKNIIKHLIAAGIDVDAQTIKLKLTALHFAAKFDNLEVIKLLVNAGADLFIRNYDDRTPLETAIRAENIDAQELLQDTLKVNDNSLVGNFHIIDDVIE